MHYIFSWRHQAFTKIKNCFPLKLRRLAMIRHENIVLYMGVSVRLGGYSIVTSAVKADSLHYRLSSRK